jgi:hypothetical protein
MGNEKDVFEWRKFGHWRSSAAKARFSAYVLWHMLDDSRLIEMARECGHLGGDFKLGIVEAFRRESAVALELVVKAVIANRLQARAADPETEGVPTTHDLPKLWKQANLPDLPREDRYRLQLVKSVLMWSGRYATPRTVKAWEEENRAFDALEEPPPNSGTFIFRTPVTVGWTEFDRLYQIAHCLL